MGTAAVWSSPRPDARPPGPPRHGVSGRVCGPAWPERPHHRVPDARAERGHARPVSSARWSTEGYRSSTARRPAPSSPSRTNETSGPPPPTTATAATRSRVRRRVPWRTRTRTACRRTSRCAPRSRTGLVARPPATRPGSAAPAFDPRPEPEAAPERHPMPPPEREARHGPGDPLPPRRNPPRDGPRRPRGRQARGPRPTDDETDTPWVRGAARPRTVHRRRVAWRAAPPTGWPAAARPSMTVSRPMTRSMGRSMAKRTMLPTSSRARRPVASPSAHRRSRAMSRPRPDDTWPADDDDARYAPPSRRREAAERSRDDDDRYAPPSRRSEGPGGSSRGGQTWSDPDADDDEDDDDRYAYAPPPPRRHVDRARDRGEAGDGRAAAAGERGRGREPGRRPPRTDGPELFGPAWERPRRYEAYPTLRSRMPVPMPRPVPGRGRRRSARARRAGAVLPARAAEPGRDADRLAAHRHTVRGGVTDRSAVPDGHARCPPPSSTSWPRARRCRRSRSSTA